MESCSALYSNSACSNRTPTPATLLPEDLNDILTDVDLQEEANRRLLEEKDAVLCFLVFPNFLKKPPIGDDRERNLGRMSTFFIKYFAFSYTVFAYFM